MSDSQLTRFMRVAVEKCGAERALALDLHMNIVDSDNFTAADIASPDFNGLTVARQALQTGELIISNNILKDAQVAPNTNTGFRDLRFVMVLPVVGQGVIYLDKTMRRGAVPKDVLQRLMQVSKAMTQAGQPLLDDAQMETVYAQAHV